MFWGPGQNVAGQFLDSSDGFTFFPNATGTGSIVLTVRITADVTKTTCDYDGWALAAQTAASALGVTYTDYAFR